MHSVLQEFIYLSADGEWKLRKVLLLISGLLALSIALSSPVWADGTTYLDPAILHVGAGAGTSTATGGGGDPNTIGSAGFDIYYNSQGSGNLPIGSPFYLIIATPVYTGSNNSPTVGGTATMYAPYSSYPGGATTVTVNTTAMTGTELTASSPANFDVYDAIGYTLTGTNSSFEFGNMYNCDIGTSSGQNACPNASLHGAGAPLAGVNITGFDISYFSINTTNFNPGDLLNFTGSLPIGSYVSAIGINGGEAWAVPFTESGLVTRAPEPSSFVMLFAGLLGLALLAGRRFLTV